MKKVLEREGIPDNGKSRAAVIVADGSAGEAIRIYNNDSSVIDLRKAADSLISTLFSADSDKLSFVIQNQKSIKNTEELYSVYSLLQKALRDITAYRAGAQCRALYFESLDSAEEFAYKISDKAAVRVDAVINELLLTADIPINLNLAITEFSSRVWDAHLI